MKHRLLEFLCCPKCESIDLELREHRTDTTQNPPEVMEGSLRCMNCSSVYSIVDGIPRMLPESFCVSTQKSFGFEWLRYQVTSHKDNIEFFRSVTNLNRNDLEGKLVLEGGCGMGRFVEVAAEFGGEVIGLDLSRSVERAYRETRHRSKVHFIQGDLMRPPLRRDLFDFVYSIGVLHHTPNTQRAFHSICRLLKAGGRIAVWVYRTYQPEIEVSWHKRFFAALSDLVNDATRAVTTRLPHRLLHFLCYGAVPIGWLQQKIHANVVTKYVFWPVLLLPFSTHQEWRVRLCDTFDWLSPRYQWKHTTDEVTVWFEEAGMLRARPLGREVSVTGVKPALRSAAVDEGADGFQKPVHHAA